MVGIDKLKQALDDGITVYQDVADALESDDKITLLEGGTLVFKHGGKAIRLIGSLKEIGEEAKDLDGEEASELVQQLVEAFGGTPEAEEALNDIAIGAGRLNQGIQKLIKMRLVSK
jgi:hypothetical protein